MSSLFHSANDVALFTQKKIIALQRAYISKGPQAANARASLAQLRRLGMPGGSSWISVGENLFDGLLDLRLSKADEEKALRAITISLRLYAYHQQSKDHPMALFSDSKEINKSRHSFGCSCRNIEFDKDKSAGVRRRMAAMEGIRDIKDLEYHLRALIMLMRDKDVQVDYYLLTRDLFLLQIPGARNDVFMRWGRDYFSAPAMKKMTDQPETMSSEIKETEATHVS